MRQEAAACVKRNVDGFAPLAPKLDALAETLAGTAATADAAAEQLAGLARFDHPLEREIVAATFAAVGPQLLPRLAAVREQLAAAAAAVDRFAGFLWANTPKDGGQ